MRSHIADVQVAAQVLTREQVIALDAFLGDDTGIQPEPDLGLGQQHVRVLDVQRGQVARAGAGDLAADVLSMFGRVIA
jgi:hypothetical protein